MKRELFSVPISFWMYILEKNMIFFVGKYTLKQCMTSESILLRQYMASECKLLQTCGLLKRIKEQAKCQITTNMSKASL